jgi:hypothetical protein
VDLACEDAVLLRKAPDLIRLLAYEGFQAAKTFLDILSGIALPRGGRRRRRREWWGRRGALGSGRITIENKRD